LTWNSRRIGGEDAACHGFPEASGKWVSAYLNTIHGKKRISPEKSGNFSQLFFGAWKTAWQAGVAAITAGRGKGRRKWGFSASRGGREEP
jgi:hypothetical protein